VEVIFTQGELFDYTALDALNTLSKQCAAAAAAASEGWRVPAATHSVISRAALPFPSVRIGTPPRRSG